MNNLRKLVLALTITVAVAACGQEEQTVAPAEPAPLTSWGSIGAENVFVPEGVSYAVVGVGENAAAEIAIVPDDAPATGRTGGVSVQLPAALETQASGSRVRVTVRASSPESGALLGVAYATNDSGNSGWQQFSLTPTPTEFSFEYDVPPSIAGNGDFLGFRSYGNGRVRVTGYRVEVLGPSAAP